MLRAKPRPTRHAATEARAWAVARELRGRRGWLLDDAFAERSWSVRLGAAAFELSAYVSLFFDGYERGGPAMVVALEWSFPEAMPPASAEEAVRSLQAALGERYRLDARRRRLEASVHTGNPNQLLAEIARVEQVLGGRAARRFGASPRSRDRRRWHVVEALRASSWRIGSLSLSRKLGDEHRQLWASIGVLVASASGRPGISASFAGWVPQATRRWKQLCADTVAGLAAAGFRDHAPAARAFHCMRWIEGLSGARALKQAALLDRSIEAGADRPLS